MLKMNVFMTLAVFALTTHLCSACSAEEPEVPCHKPRCRGPHEVYKSCATEYDLTCKNQDNPLSCSQECMRGCFCEEGYVRNRKNICILPCECPTKCPRNEIFDGCPPSYRPEKSCDEFIQGNEPCHPKPCKPGCKCRLGYVRNHKGVCVVPRQCCADPNAELVRNPNPCPGGTCLHPTFIACRADVPALGCQCKRGYVKKSATDSTCIRISHCCGRSNKPCPCAKGSGETD